MDFSTYDFTNAYFVDPVFTSDCTCGAFLLFAEFGCSHWILHLKWENVSSASVLKFIETKWKRLESKWQAPSALSLVAGTGWPLRFLLTQAHFMIQCFLGLGSQWRGGWQSVWGWMTPFAWCTVQELGLTVKLWMWTEAGEPCLLSICIAHFTYRHSFNSIWNEV